MKADDIQLLIDNRWNPNSRNRDGTVLSPANMQDTRNVSKHWKQSEHRKRLVKYINTYKQAPWCFLWFCAISLHSWDQKTDKRVLFLDHHNLGL